MTTEEKHSPLPWNYLGMNVRDTDFCSRLCFYFHGCLSYPGSGASQSTVEQTACDPEMTWNIWEFASLKHFSTAEFYGSRSGEKLAGCSFYSWEEINPVWIRMNRKKISWGAENNQIQQHFKKTENTCTLECNIIPAAHKEQQRWSNTTHSPLMPTLPNVKAFTLLINKKHKKASERHLPASAIELSTSRAWAMPLAKRVASSLLPKLRPQTWRASRHWWKLGVAWLYLSPLPIGQFITTCGNKGGGITYNQKF